MREILFRGKRLDNVEWIYGSHVRLPNAESTEATDKRTCDTIQISPSTRLLVVPKTVGQYTTMNDKDGTRIFDGDEVLIDIDDGMPSISTVVWWEDGWHLTDGNSFVHLYPYNKDAEVVGNIHDKKEVPE